MDDELQRVSSLRRRSQLGVIAVVLVALVGVVVWQRSNGTPSPRPVSVAATVAPNPASVTFKVVIGTTTLSTITSVQGVQVPLKGPGTGLTLIRATSTDSYFVKWMAVARADQSKAARDMTISFLQSSTLKVERTVKVTGAVPVSLTYAPVQAGVNLVKETLVLSYTDIAAA